MPLKAYCFKYGPPRESKEGEKKKENERKEEIFSNVPATNDSPALISY